MLLLNERIIKVGLFCNLKNGGGISLSEKAFSDKQ